MSDPPTSAAAHPSEPHASLGTGADLEASIFGVMDGLVTNLAVIAGVVAAGQPAEIVRIAGVSAMLAGALSMFVGAWVSSRARYELAHRELRREHQEVEQVPETEKAEVREIFENWGFPHDEAKAVAERLSHQKEHWIDFMMKEELGFAKEDLVRPPKRHGAIIGFSYLVGSLIPLLPFLLTSVVPSLSAPMASFEVGLVLSVAALAGVGAYKERFGGQRPLLGAVQLVGIGLGATAAVYIITNLIFHI